MKRWQVWLLAGLMMAVIAAAIYFPILRRRVRQAARLQQQSEEQARRELAQPLTPSAGEPRVRAQLFWSSGDSDGTLAPATVELPLSSDPVLRAKQVVNTLLAGPVDADLRTLPPDAVLLAFYLLPDGTGIADFSEALATATPSGIQSEQMAVDSLTKTLDANVPQVRRLKILIHGQEVDTLAGHLDLTQAFVVSTKAAPMADKSMPSVSPSAAGAAPSAVSPPPKPNAPQTTAAPEKLTPAAAPGKLAQPERKP